MLRRRSSLCLAVIATIALASGCSASDAPSESTAQLASAPADTRTVATLALRDFGSEMAVLGQRGYDIAGVDLERSHVDLIVEADTLADLRAEGFQVVRTAALPALEEPQFEEDTYKTPEDIAAIVHDYAQRFPTLATAQSIGRSNEGRDIWAVRIATGPHSPSKPVVLYNGAHHARELMSVEVPLDTIDTLLTGYESDPKIKHWVDANEIWVVPMLNVDGSHRVFTNDTMWRKNGRGCNNATSCPSHTGVDINRNYPYGWASCNGSSTSTRADDYHGPSAASEPETNAMMNLVANVRPVFDISYHAFSEVVLYPYGCQGQHVPSQAIVADIGKKMSQKLPSDDSPGRFYRPGTPWELLYSADGGDIDWMYHEYQVVPFAIELNGMRQGFRPAYGTWRDKTVQKARAAWQLLLDRVDGSGVRGVVRDAPAGTQVSVAGDITQTRPINPDGSFHVVTLPGTFRVTVTAPGHAAFVQAVTVADARIDLDVTLP